MRILHKVKYEVVNNRLNLVSRKEFTMAITKKGTWKKQALKCIKVMCRPTNCVRRVACDTNQYDCPLREYKDGTDPYPIKRAPVPEERKQKMREHAAYIRERRLKRKAENTPTEDTSTED